MRNILNVIAVILIMIWAIGFLAYHVVSGLIHLLLAFAVIAIMLSVIKRRKRVK